MIEKMKPINGYFKIEKFDLDGNLISTYEDHNQIMTRVPELYAGTCSGFYSVDASRYAINSVAMGTYGTRFDALGNEIPKEISASRLQMFSEEAFWNDMGAIEDNRPVLEENKVVYQRTWENVPIGDIGEKVSGGTFFSGGNEGCTYPLKLQHPDNGNPIDENNPVSCNDKLYSLIPLDDNTTVGTNYRKPFTGGVLTDIFSVEGFLEGSVITYQIEMGQYVGNNSDGTNRQYTEAALYMDYLDNNADLLCTGDTLGQLFSMKTFPPQYKNNTCAIKITWKLYF